MRKNIFLSSLAIHLIVTSGASGATVFFDFRTNQGASGVVGADLTGTGTDFDPSGVGDTIILPLLTTTIVDVLAPEYDTSGALPVLTGNTVSGAAGDNVLTNVSGQDSLGINNPSIGNGDFDLIGGGGESSDINVGESVVFTFDRDVIFTEIELESVVATDGFEVLVGGFSVLNRVGDDSFLDDLEGLTGLTIAAGTEITFSASAGDVATSSFRIETFTVDVIPEPSSLALLALGGLMMAKRRRS